MKRRVWHPGSRGGLTHTAERGVKPAPLRAVRAKTSPPSASFPRPQRRMTGVVILRDTTNLVRAASRSRSQTPRYLIRKRRMPFENRSARAVARAARPGYPDGQATTRRVRPTRARMGAAGAVGAARQPPRLSRVAGALRGHVVERLRDRLAELVGAGLLHTDDAGRYGLSRHSHALLEALKPLSSWAEEWGAG
jgi:hypothetical protein